MAISKITTLFVLLALTALPLACGDEEGESASGGSEPPATSSESGGSADSSSQQFPDVESAEATMSEDGTYDFDVTISSPYDSPERYADGWRVLGPDGEVLGEMELGHDHAAEQPFTRTQIGVEVPDDVQQVTIEGHDLENGYGGGTAEVELTSG